MSEKKCKRDNTYCCVPQCNSKGSKNPHLSFHKFPNEKFKFVKTCTITQRKILVSQRKEWIRLLRTAKEITPRMSVCSKHFKEDDYKLPSFPNTLSTKKRLKRDAVPTLNLPKWPSETQKVDLETSEKKKQRERSCSNLKVPESNETEITPVTYEEEEMHSITDECLYEEKSDSVLDSGNISYNSNEAIQIAHLEKDANVLLGIKEEISSDSFSDDEEINLIRNESSEILKDANVLPGIKEEISSDISSDDEEINLIGNESSEILKMKLEKLSAHHKKLKIRFKESQVLCKLYAKEIASLKGIIDSLRQIIKVSNDT